MTTKIQTALRLALEAKRFMDLIDIEMHRTRRGHWHPATVPCARRCPVSDPRTALVFSGQLHRAAAFAQPAALNPPVPSSELGSQPRNAHSAAGGPPAAGSRANREGRAVTDARGCLR